jgi:hypothetical protein
MRGFELRALGLQCRCCTTWATPPVHFALINSFQNYLPWLVSNLVIPDLSLPSS